MARLSTLLLTATLLATTVSAQQQVYRAGNGVTLPTIVKEVKPEYTRAAMNAGIQGTVTLKVVVADDGHVSDVAVTKSLDDTLGLDQEATKAAYGWLFKPGTKDGKPVAVEIALEMTFALK
jgi:protein TonB